MGEVCGSNGLAQLRHVSPNRRFTPITCHVRSLESEGEAHLDGDFCGEGLEAVVDC